MASTVQTGGGSGVDLSELTSGELLFCSLLKTGYIDLDSSAEFRIGYNIDTDGRDIDMSKISQISFIAKGYEGGSGSVQWQTNTVSTRKNFSAGASFSISAPSGDNSHCAFKISSNSNGYPYIKVTSFTTTDGTVHTASNLNY